MFLSEAHDLQVGQSFSFSETGPLSLVSDTGIIDYEGNALVLYSTSDGLHGHLRDHTPVWVLPTF